MTKILAALAVGTCTLAVIYGFTAEPVTNLELTTFSGELYIIGSGDTCMDAWTDHGPFPSDWRDVRCVTE
jgi:hypothetical protein